MLERMLDRLDLSEEQKEALDKPLQAHRETMDADRDKMFEARRSLEDAVHAETFDEAAIRHAVRAVAEVEAGMAVSRAGMLRDLRKVLTPAQRDKLETMRQNRQEFMQERFQGGPDSGRRLRDRD